MDSVHEAILNASLSSSSARCILTLDARTQAYFGGCMCSIDSDKCLHCASSVASHLLSATASMKQLRLHSLCSIFADCQTHYMRTMQQLPRVMTCCHIRFEMNKKA